MKEILFDSSMERKSSREVLERLTWQQIDGNAGFELRSDFYVIHYKPMDGKIFRHVTEPPFNRLFFVSGAAIHLKTGSEWRTVESGGGVLIPAGLPFHVHYADHGRLLYIHFSCRNRIGEDVFWECRRVLELSGVALRLGQNLFHEEREPADSGILWSVIRSLIPAEALHRAREVSNLGKLLPRFFQLLETVPPAQLRVKELADRLGVSTSTLGREFSRYLHRPVKEYLTGYLKDRIRLAMQNGRRSLSDTAAQLGFADDAYFHRTFKRLFGLTPAAFRAGGHGAE